MANKRPANAEVKLRKGESVDSLIRRFTRQLKRSGNMENIKEKGPTRRFKSKREIRVEREKASIKRKKQAERRAKDRKRMRLRSN